MDGLTNLPSTYFLELLSLKMKDSYYHSFAITQCFTPTLSSINRYHLTICFPLQIP